MCTITKNIQPKRLIAFDFDHTIVNGNTDIVVRDLIDKDKIPYETQQLYKSNGWTVYMGEIFKLLHKNGIRETDIKSAVENIPELPGMIDCIKYLKSNNFDIIIISDANSEFISHWNECQNISHYFDDVFTNPAKFNGNELLLLEPFHIQNECNISSTNLCKGKVLMDYLRSKEQNCVIYENIFFVGDGFHDICGMLKLNNKGYACPRIGFAAEKDIYKVANEIQTPVNATLIKWDDGLNLLEQIKFNLKLD